MHIGLVEPSPDLVAGVDTKTPHLGLLYVAAALLREGHKVDILDIKVATKQEIEEFFAKRHDAIGISVTSASFNYALAIIRKVKQLYPDIPIVVGGPHVSVSGKDVLEYGEIDFAIYGEGEITAVELFGLLQDNPRPSSDRCQAINGIIYRDGSKIRMSSPRELIKDIDSVPFPAMDLVPLERYTSYSIITSRGCPFKCTYCSTPLIWNGKWRARSADNIIDEIEYLAEKGGKKYTYINDDNFTLDIKRAHLICDKIIEKNFDLRFSSMGIRADRVDLPLLQKMYKAGIVSLSVGVESANAEVLKSIKKGETLEDITRGLRLAKKVGMRIVGLFMIGNPGDTLDTAKETIDFALKEDFDEVIFALALPYPKTGLWDYVEKEGRWIKKDYINFSHFSDQPIFETPEFPLKDRIEAYRLAQKCVLKVRSRKYMTSVFSLTFLRKIFSRRLFSKESVGRFTSFLKIYITYRKPK